MLCPLLEHRERERPDPVARELRRRLLVGLRGRVLEVGCGDGRSFEHYPTSVTQLVAVEPDATARAVAAERAGAAVAIELAVPQQAGAGERYDPRQMAILDSERRGARDSYEARQRRGLIVRADDKACSFAFGSQRRRRFHWRLSM